MNHSEVKENSAKKNRRSKKVRDDNDESSGSDIDQEGLFLFSSSLSVGSSFITTIIDSETDDTKQKDTVFIGPNQDGKNRNNYIGYFGLKNTTNQAIVAYYIYSNFEVGKIQKYKLNPCKGFLHPGQIQLITLSKIIESREDHDAAYNSHDLVFIKALPLDENQINSTNVNEYEMDLESTFHQFNVDLLFTLEVLSIEFVYEPVLYPQFEHTAIAEQKHMDHNIDQAGYQSVVDEADEESEHMSSKHKPSLVTSKGFNMNSSTKDELRFNKASKLNKGHDNHEERKELLQTFGKADSSKLLSKKNTLIEDIPMNANDSSSKQSSEVETLTKQPLKIKKENPVVKKEAPIEIDDSEDNQTDDSNINENQKVGQNSGRHESHISEDVDEESQLIATIKNKLSGIKEETDKNQIQRSETKKNKFIMEEIKEKTKSNNDKNQTTNLQNSELTSQPDQLFPIDSKSKSANGFGKVLAENVFESNYDQTTIDRKQTVYDADHYNKMENELENLDININEEKYIEESKFEGAMRLASMDIKLTNFDRAQKKLSEVLQVHEEVDEEQNDEHDEEAEEIFKD